MLHKVGVLFDLEDPFCFLRNRNLMIDVTQTNKAFKVISSPITRNPNRPQSGRSKVRQNIWVKGKVLSTTDYVGP